MKKPTSREILTKNVNDFLELSSPTVTMEQLGEMCGTSKQYISKLKKGTVNPSLEFYDQLAKGMGCTVADLFTIDLIASRLKLSQKKNK